MNWRVQLAINILWGKISWNEQWWSSIPPISTK